MNEDELQNWLHSALNDAEAYRDWEGDGGEVRIKNITTFEDAGILTHAKGLVVRFPDGSKAHFTVQKA